MYSNYIHFLNDTYYNDIIAENEKRIGLLDIIDGLLDNKIIQTIMDIKREHQEREKIYDEMFHIENDVLNLLNGEVYILSKKLAIER